MIETREEWVEEAAEADILQIALQHGAKLRRAGREWVGPCPACGGEDRFQVNPSKRRFICRGSSGGNVISLVQHLDGSTFIHACETLTGRPPPGYNSSETPAERKAREQRVEEAKKARAEREAIEETKEREDRANRRQSAGGIWRECVSIARTLAERYLIGRGIDPKFCNDVELRFHSNLFNADSRQRFPALVALVRDPDGAPIGIWRIWLGDGRKGRAPIQSPKKGLGDFRDRGGAVRIGGIAEEIGLGEGIETSCAARELCNGAMPVWPALSTYGIASFIVPKGVRRVIVFEDADLWKYDAEKDKWTKPAGNSASKALAERYAGSDVEIVIEPPGINTKVDYVDVLRAVKGLPREE